MKKEYKFNRGDTFKFFYKIILELFFWYIITIAIIFFVKDKNIEALKLFSLILGLIWTILTIIPLIFLFINHKKHSKSIALIVNSEENTFSYKSANGIYSFKIEEIEKVMLNLSSASYEKWIDWLFFGKYHYSIIKFKNGKSIVISCLVCDEIENVLSENIIIRVKKAIPLIEYVAGQIKE
jgi:hypothetical protein